MTLGELIDLLEQVNDMKEEISSLSGEARHYGSIPPMTQNKIDNTYGALLELLSREIGG